MTAHFPYDLILASASPRRRELLHRLGFHFRVEAVNADETPDPGRAVERLPAWLAAKKAELVNTAGPNSLILAADTLVLLGNRILAKPAGPDEARVMLKSLSGTTHRVITGVCLKGPLRKKTFSETTRVRFNPMQDAEIEHYIETSAPFDKAGGYGLQEWIGLAFAGRISGSYTNVVGLPTERLYTELKKAALFKRY